MFSREYVGRLLFRSVFLSLTALLQSPLYAQSDLTREELKGLQNQIDSLKEAQETILRELQEIKGLLQGRAAPSALTPPNLIVSVDAKSFKGDRNAKLTLIEFSDYQCPFCARHFRETLPQIEKDYINTGKIKYVLRDFPLESIHNDAFKAAEAVNCAGEQGKYWEMHERLFQNQSQLGPAELPKHAQAIGLKTAPFEECLRNGRQGAEIRKDMEDGQKAGVQGTPTFFLGIQDSDSHNLKVLRVIVGAQPYGQFQEAIEGVLREIKK